MSHPGERSDKLPFVVLLMTLGTFLMSTTEFMIAGLLPQMASDLGVSISQAGLLITAFAIGMIVGAPAMAIATLRMPRRSTLTLALLIFAAGHVVAALSDSFGVVLASRVLTALVTGAFWSVAAVVATDAAGPAARSRALGVMMSGVGLATVVGVPLGSLVGELIGWRGAFWALAAISLAAAVVIARTIPAEEDRAIPSIRSELTALRQRRIWLLLAASSLTTGGFLGAYSFISPLLTDRAGISEGAVPLVLIGFGVGALIGTNVSGRLGDRRPLATFFAAAVGAATVMLLIIPLSIDPVSAIILTLLLGLTGMSIPPVVTALAVRFAGAAPTLGAALAVSAFNAGTAVGSWVAGRAIASSLGTTGPALVGAAMAALGLIPLLVLAATRATRDPAAAPAPRPDGSMPIHQDPVCQAV